MENPLTDAASPVHKPESAKAQHILAAAGTVFMREGFANASVDEIVREADVSKSTVYAHFAGKEQLFAAVVGTQCQRLADAVSHGDSEVLPLRDALMEIGRRVLTLFLSPRGRAIFRIVIAEAPRFPELGRIFYQVGAELLHRRLSDFIANAHGRNELVAPDPFIAAAHLIGLLKTDLQFRSMLFPDLEFEPAEIDRNVTLAVDAFLKIYGKP